SCRIIVSSFHHTTAYTETYTLSLHDALPILIRTHKPKPDWAGRKVFAKVSHSRRRRARALQIRPQGDAPHPDRRQQLRHREGTRDRKSTRLNSSHQIISYAVFCLKKKKNRHA